MFARILAPVVLSSVACVAQQAIPPLYPPNVLPNSRRFTCTFRAEHDVWMPGEPFIVTIRLENKTDHVLDISADAMFELKNELADWESFTDIVGDRSSEHPELAPHLHIPKDGSAEFRVDLTRTKWGIVWQNVMPSSNLASVPPGPYVLILRLDDMLDEACNRARVTLDPAPKQR